MSEWLMIFIVIGNGVYYYETKYYSTQEACEAGIAAYASKPSGMEAGYTADCLPVGAEVDAGRHP